MIKKVSAGARDGDEVLIRAHGGEPLGRGFYHGGSTVALRILSKDPHCALDRDFFRERLRAAVALRRETLGLEKRTNAYRVVHAEGDGLSGLVVDRYGELLVAGFYSRGFFDRRELLQELLLEIFPDSRVVFKVDNLAAEREGMVLPAGEENHPENPEVPEETEIHEGKVRFLIRPTGHKTGFFLDQRENRERLAGLVRGRKFLDAFSYTGAFALVARTRGKARRVVALDLDEKAIEQGKRNARLNRAEIEWVHSDAFPYLRNHRHAAERYDAICLDPPKWATDRARLEEAENKYLDVNTYALRALDPGGILVTCCCSGLVSEPRFLAILNRAAAVAGRTFQVFHVGGAGADHPVDIHCPESRYLKAVFGRVT